MLTSAYAVSARLPFNPGLNQTVLADLPGLPPGAAGSRVNQWLCSWAIGQRMASSPELVTAACALAGGVDRLRPLPTVEAEPTPTSALIVSGGPWPTLLNALVSQGFPPATVLADDLGRVLGGLVGTLARSSAASRAGRPEWPVSHWEAWRRAQRVAVGGGIVVDALGRRMVEAAKVQLVEAAVPVDVFLAREPSGLVLRGAAAGDVTPGLPVGLVLDCGGTTLKAAVVASGVLQPRPGVPAPGVGWTGRELVEHLAQAAAQAAPPGDGHLGVALALATYVDDSGQPYADQLGPYAGLGSLDLVGDLTLSLTRRLGRPVTVRVRHDGASALLGARLDDPRVDAAIVLGTAVGHAVRCRGSGST